MPTETNKQPLHVQHNISHIRQRYSWDCGITCVLMVLGDKGREFFLDNFSRILEEEGLHQRTWTIDLCYLLKRFDVRLRMYTVREIVRVRKKFDTAKANDIKIVQGFLSMQQIVQHVINYGPAILLVDVGLLTCDLCKNNTLSSEIRKMFGGSYKGHYVCLVGVSRNRLLYGDPARPHNLCSISAHRLQQARCSTLTDFDVILIYK